MFKKTQLLLLFVILAACKNDQPLIYTEQVITPKTQANIELVFPKFKDNSNLAVAINKTIEQTIAKRLTDTDKTITSLEDAIKKIDLDYKRFKEEFHETELEWEVFVDSEVTYQSQDIICIALNTYINTGGAHGNAFIEFLNFNTETGLLLSQDELLNNREEFKQLAKTYFIKTMKDKPQDGSIENYFQEDTFKLPEQIGFNDDGVILLYNTYEILPNTQSITEFTIPFSKVDSYLKHH